MLSAGRRWWPSAPGPQMFPNLAFLLILHKRALYSKLRYKDGFFVEVQMPEIHKSIPELEDFEDLPRHWF